MLTEIEELPRVDQMPKDGSKGLVSSLETMTATDGPGLRLIMFLQGCFLRCRYCCNPDTQEMSHCESKVYSVEEIKNLLIKGKNFYRSRKGGLTLSGGDPLVQPEYCAELFKATHSLGMHTTLCTDGFTPVRNWDIVLPHTDLVIQCIKSFDLEAFKNITGCNHVAFKRCLDFNAEVEKRGIEWWLQWVVIPGVTDTDEELKSLMEYINGCEKLTRVELLQYHTLGLVKYERMGVEYPGKDFKECSMDDLQKTRDYIISNSNGKYEIACDGYDTVSSRCC